MSEKYGYSNRVYARRGHGRIVHRVKTATRSTFPGRENLYYAIWACHNQSSMAVLVDEIPTDDVTLCTGCFPAHGG
jgi:hypothetical protein